MVCRLVAFILRQRVTNFEPWCLVAHKDVTCGADGWLVHEGAQSHVHTITNHRIKQRAANFAVNVVVRIWTSIQEYLLSSIYDAKLVSFNTSKWLKSRTGRLATIRAVAIQRILELVGHFVENAAT
jgi:hypothetical protein